MVLKSIIGTTCAFLTVVSFNADAALMSRLGGLAYYDDVADLTWLADANAARTSGYAIGGRMTWIDANAWVAGLDVMGVSGWRLPDTLQPDASCGSQINGASSGFGCTGSEMGNLFYNVLGGETGTSITTTHNANYDLFSNVQSNYYWSSTQYPGTLTAWLFNMSNAYQYNFGISNRFYAWAVQSGDVSAVPVPPAVWLFGSGLLGLAGVARRKKL